MVRRLTRSPCVSWQGHHWAVWRLFEASLSDQSIQLLPTRSIHLAAMSGDESLVEEALKTDPVDALTDRGATPLMLASRYGHLNSVQLLLGRRAVVDAASDLKCTALSMVSAAALYPDSCAASAECSCHHRTGG